jgi:hypothetical protein
MFCPNCTHELDGPRFGTIYKCQKCDCEWEIDRIESPPTSSPHEPEDEAEFCHECDDFTVINGKCHECGKEYDDR